MRPGPSASRLRLAVVLGLILLGGLWWRRPGNALVVYCAHDAVFADAILRDFEKQTGVKVAVRYDTEATKSLGLVELLARERSVPRCDVFWNNELLGTMDLAERGVFASYRGSGWERIPPSYRDPDGRWTGFAARFRVLIVHSDAVPAAVGGAQPPLPAHFNRWALAKPIYGTTLTHFAVMWKEWGAELAKRWHDDRRRGGIRILNGNGAVKDAVAAGACDVGFTDTDDFFDARDSGARVSMWPVRLDDGRTICIPNTVGIIQGSRRSDQARRLVDFLLSAETELALARSKSRQVPLGAVSSEQLPAEVKELIPWVSQGVPLTGMTNARQECLAWLKSQYAD